MAERNKDLAKKCWKHGSEALAKQNWDLAIQMFIQAAKEDPANLFYRQNLRGAEKKKYGDNGKGAGMSGLKLRSPKSSVKKAKSKKNWDEMDVAAEEGLRINPWDVDLNTAVAEAAAEREYYQVAKFAYNEAPAAGPGEQGSPQKIRRHAGGDDGVPRGPEHLEPLAKPRQRTTRTSSGRSRTSPPNR